MTSLAQLLSASIAALAVAALPTVVAAQTPPAPDGVLSLTASASVEVTKDLLAVTFTATRDGTDANVVQGQLKQALDAALAEAKKVTRPGDLEVHTGNFSLYPRYSQKSQITGWQGSAELVVEGRDLAGIGQLSGRITTMTIGRVAYRLSREAGRRVESDLAAEAIGAFRAKATLYAKQFGYGGVTMREVNVSTSDAGFTPIPLGRMQATAASSGEALAVEPGRAVVTATVNGTVQMK